jgi:hypothetical protein
MDFPHKTNDLKGKPVINPEVKRFSTEEKAKAYIYWNKPQYSLKEIVCNHPNIPKFGKFSFPCYGN